jgi:hypothetical protein
MYVIVCMYCNDLWPLKAKRVRIIKLRNQLLDKYKLGILFAEHNFGPFVIVLFERVFKTLFRVLFLSLYL